MRPEESHVTGIASRTFKLTGRRRRLTAAIHAVLISFRTAVA